MSVYKNAKHFWEQFQSVEDRLFLEEGQEDTQMLKDLAMSYTGSALLLDQYGDQKEFTFDTGPNKTSQYLANYFVSLAPQSIVNSWILNASLPPLSSKAMSSVQIKDQIYALQDFFAFYKPIEDTQTFCVSVYCSGFSLIKNPEHKREMSMYLLELALGECFYEAYIGQVETMDTPDDSKGEICSLIELYERLDEEVTSRHYKTYEMPIDIYSVYRPIQDFAHDSLRKDMKYIFTTHPLLIEETIENKTDVLWDLSSKDGEFGYIYYTNPFSNQEDALFRQTLSKQLEKAMEASHAAYMIGGAIGKSFSYIDWIVMDHARFEKTFEVIKKQLDPKIELHYRSFEQDHELS